MEGSDGSPLQSLCMIRAAELFPKPQMEKEDIQLMVPFQELAGESVKYLGRTDDGVLALSNYRIFLLKNSTYSETSVPLGLIEFAQTRDLFHLIINCKDASTVKCSFETAEQCSEWQRRIHLSVGVPESLESLFAFPFCSWTCDNLATNGDAGETEANGGGVNHSFVNGEHLTSLCSGEYSERLQRASRYEDDFMREVERLGFDLNGSWRISLANEDFKLCPSYPQKILVPCCISDETLQTVANFRGSRRLPAVVWRHKKSGAVIARCSQPEVGWLGWRNSRDEQLLKALADACAFDRGEQMRKLTQAASAFGMTLPSGSESIPSSPDGSHEEVALDEVRKVLIVDARSYTSAVTNRARGGGCECIEYYPCAEIEFMNLGNIHVIRKSFHALRQLCASPADVPNWLGMLEKTMWLQHLSGLLAASVTVCHAIERKGRPVLVHCSDGWDRTPQIVATAQLCLDPYYRTVEGFRILVDREWLNYGHKFADRCGHGPGSDEQNERCPVFLQWLDLVHQIHKQFPCSFEFSMGYLIKLAQHSLSCLFGTFFCNTLKERIENSVFERTFSVWPFLSGPMYRNPLYVPNREKVLWPAHNLRDLSVWTEVYLGSLGNKNSADFSPCTADGLQGSIPMAKTRSYGDFITSGITLNGISRRSSDPNMAVDPNLTIDSNSENNSVADIQSEREDSPDFVANIIHDTTRKLQNLTTELNNHEENIYNSKEIENKGKSHDILEYNLENSPIHSTDESDEQYIANSLSSERKLQHPQQQQQQTNSSALFKQLENNTVEPAAIYSSSPPLTMLKNGCEINSNSLPALSTSTSSVLPSSVAVSISSEETQNNFNGFLNTLNDIGKSRCNGEKKLFDKFDQRVAAEGGGIVTVHTTNMNLDLMQSVDLSEPIQENLFTSATSTEVTPIIESVVKNGQSILSHIEDVSWLGSVHASTDTLVPIELQRVAAQNGDSKAADDEHDEIDCTFECLDKRPTSYAAKNEARTLNISYNTTTHATQQQNDILPKVHIRPNMLSTSVSASSNTLQSPSSPSFSFTDLNHQLNNINNTNNSTTNKNINNTKTNSKCDAAVSSDDDNVPTTTTTTSNLMEESILILPEHQKLEISISGKCETITNNIAAGTTAIPATKEDLSITVGAGLETAAAASTTTTPLSSAAPTFTTTQRRRRTSSSNSRRDCVYTAKAANGSTTSRFAIPGVRSLPLTPPGLPERSQIPISCPDGLAHALSEQNIRLQQIVHEHKLREDVLLREIHDMRMALLKKTCPNCNNATNDDQVDDILNGVEHKIFDFSYCALCATYRKINKSCCCNRRRQYYRRRRQARGFCNADNDDDGSDDDDESLVFFGSSSASVCSAMENIENASICSWEAVEERSSPSSCTSSSLQPNPSSVLWVPDHAVSRCTSCQTEFWLGRRKHHCRSCGQIFCADCSEFVAPLPDEKLFSPVRLCGPCYHLVTTRMQQQQQQFQRYKRNSSSTSSSNNNIGNVAGAAANALTLKTLSALALAQKTKAAINTAATNSKESNVQQQQQIAAASLNGSNMLSTSIATKIIATKPIGVATCCNHAATVATKCQQHQRTATMKTAAASN